jgi:Zn finger protein HypA/HybF involved in hydrogenase expression
MLQLRGLNSRLSGVLIRVSIAVAIMLATSVAAQAQTSPGSASSACAGCHRAKATSQPQTPMGRALLLLPGPDAALKANPKLTFHKGGYTYTVETRGDNSTYSVTDGKGTISSPIHWSFGNGAQTWVFEREGKWYEGLVSYYPNIQGLDITIGDAALTPHTLEEAFGRELLHSEPKDCFGCHATNAAQNGKLNLDSMQPGVRCEHCHVGANTHLLDSLQGQFDSAPPKLGKMTTEDISSFCGQCHRSWEAVMRGHTRGIINVRFQPYRLANSKCFDGADPRISCLACHDPHQDVVREDSSYDGKCLVCHGSSPEPASASGTAGAKSCPVSKKDCVSCHMPKMTLPGGHMRFTDHEIRVVKAGDPYPD